MLKRCSVVVVAALVAIPLTALAVDFDYYDVTPNVGIGDHLGDPLPTIEFKALLTNNEVTPQDFHIHKDENTSSFMWTVPFCVNELCFSPFVVDETTTVAPGATDTLKVWFNAMFEEGESHVILSVWPVGVPGEAVAETTACITNGLDVLLVDDDGGQAHEAIYAAALPGGKTSGVWPRSVQAPTAAELAQFDATVWFTGATAPAGGDATVLKNFLDGGGKLFLAGQDIAYSFCDLASPNQSAPACQLITDYLGASYTANSSGTSDVTGDAGDIIGDGFSFTLGGTETSPDALAENGGNDAFLYNGTAHVGGMSAADGDMRAVYLAFGLEGVPSSGDRSTIMQRAFDFFNATVGVESGDAPAPAGPVLGPNRPNPFNPTTSFTIRLGEASDVTFSIYDASGRLVRALHDGRLGAGETAIVWDGLNDAGASVRSGVYFATMKTDEVTKTRKVTLVR